MTEAQTARLQTIVTELENGDMTHLGEYNVLAQKARPSNLFGQPLHKANYAVEPGPVQQSTKEVGTDTTSRQHALESASDNSTRSNEKIALVAQVAYTKSAWQHDPDKLDAYTVALSALEQYEQQEKQRG